MYPMSQLLALVAEKRWQEADELMMMVRGDWLSDPRFPALAATIGIARGNLDLAEEWLQATADEPPVEYEDPLIRRLWTGRVDRQLVRDLRQAYPGSWNDFVATSLVLEQRYYVLLWRQEYDAARRYAERMVNRFREMKLATMTWIVREADATFYQEEYGDARELYEAVLRASPGQTAILLKLSDVHFMLGNADLERSYREKIYGTLERKPDDWIDGASRSCPPVAVDADGDELR
jgi:tetratricopeptide (TPR) repeat protein